jgi:hypothetical protein
MKHILSVVIVLGCVSVQAQHPLPYIVTVIGFSLCTANQYGERIPTGGSGRLSLSNNPGALPTAQERSSREYLRKSDQLAEVQRSIDLALSGHECFAPLVGSGELANNGGRIELPLLEARRMVGKNRMLTIGVVGVASTTRENPLVAIQISEGPALAPSTEPTLVKRHGPFFLTGYAIEGK